MASPSDPGAETPQDLTEPLPVRLAIHDNEALDSYLERTCTANKIAPATLLRRLTTQAPACGDQPVTTAAASCTFMMLNPDPALLDQIAHATATSRDAVEQATLRRFNAGLPLHLDALDPYDRYSLRQVAMQGWFPGYGTQVCPMCLAADQIWQVAWRLPINTICLRHSTYLAAECPTCRQQFRNHHHVVLRRPAWPDLTCDNPLGDRSHCRQSLDQIAASGANPEQIHTAERVTTACNGTAVGVLGQTWPPADYLRLLRSLSVLLLHLATQPGAEDLASWATDVTRAGAGRGTIKSARWALTPPHDTRLRSAVLTEADQILSAGDRAAAAEQLNRWTRLTPNDANGQLAWQTDHTTATAELLSLLQAAMGRRRHIIAQLRPATLATVRPHEALPPPDTMCLPANAIPQVLPLTVYDQHLHGLFDGLPITARRYVTLCLMHRRPEIRSWAQAAERLTLETGQGRRTARTASQRLQVTPARLGEAILAIEHQLPTTIDYRAREIAVKDIAVLPAARRQLTAMLRAIGVAVDPDLVLCWLWCQFAAGDPGFIPGQDPAGRWQTAARCSAAARFEATLTGENRAAIAALVCRTPRGS